MKHTSTKPFLSLVRSRERSNDMEISCFQEEWLGALFSTEKHWDRVGLLTNWGHFGANVSIHGYQRLITLYSLESN